MMDSEHNDSGLRKGILEKLSAKALLKQKVHDNTFQVFNDLKELLNEMSSEISDELEEKGRRIRTEYRDRGKFEAQLQIADDIFFFTMHTNVFQFNREHSIWNTEHVKTNPSATYCGMISIYNFLSDSFKYNRAGDEGYLICRVFINENMNYFVEGKRQTSNLNYYGTRSIDRAAMMNIVESAIDYGLDFDLLVPPYDNVKVITTDQLSSKLEGSKMVTGKRLGYSFNSDDI